MKIRSLILIICILQFSVKAQNKNINLIKGADKKIKKENLGENINSPFTEIAPVISSDGKTLYFSRNKHPKNYSSKDDIWFSTMKADGTWEKAQNIGKPINNKVSNNIISISPDGNTMYVLHNYNKDGSFKSVGLSVSNKIEKGWNIPKSITINGFYNKSNFIGYCFSADRKVLIMYLQRDDTFGDLDLYVSFIQEDKTWSEPKNLGSTINSPKGEATPFLAADNTTLYYASSGKPGYGSYDIFMSRRLDDTWTNWSEPQNLGNSINSPGFDAYYSVPASGEYAYLVSSLNSVGAEDIFRIKLPEAARPKPVVLIRGKVLDKNKNPISTEIKYYDLESGKEIGLASSSVKDGSYQIVLPAGKKYSFLAEKKGYFAVSENMDLSKLDKYEEMQRDLYLFPIKKDEEIRLNSLFFETAKSHLKQESHVELNRLIKFLKDNPKIKIEIGGHTDSKGSDSYNYRLSEKRAKAVVKYLKTKIKTNRLKAKGYGETKAVGDNSTEEGRAKNRRVEFKILEL